MVATSGSFEPDVELVRVERGAAGQRAHLHLMAGGDVDDDLGGQVGEAEGERLVVGDLLDEQIEVALARRQQPRGLAAAPDRPFADDRRARSAERDARLRAVAAAFAQRHLDLRAGAVAEALRVAAVVQRHRVEDVAVDHADGPAVLDALHAVAEKPARHAVDGQSDAAEVAAAHRELRVEIVGGGDARQDVHRAHRVVEHQAAQVLQVGAAQHLLGGHGGLALPEQIAGDFDAFGVGARAFGERNDEVDGPAVADGDARAGP